MSDEMDRSHKPEALTQKTLSEGRERREVSVGCNPNSRRRLLVGAIVSPMVAPAAMGNPRLVLDRYFALPHRHVVDSLAQHIRATAETQDIAIVEHPCLARALYAGVDLDEEMPPEHYQVVAEVVGYVWSLEGRAMPKERRRDE